MDVHLDPDDSDTCSVGSLCVNPFFAVADSVIRDGVVERFGVRLRPEAHLVGVEV